MLNSNGFGSGQRLLAMTIIAFVVIRAVLHQAGFLA
jgi:hypothetical protein